MKASAEYHLYRVKIIKSAQLNLFNPDLTPAQIFEKILNDRPSGQLRKSNVWHIGNIDHFEGSVGRFAVGRSTLTTIEKYDKNTGNFNETIDDSGPYTYVYYDASIGLLGIGKKPKVASEVKQIASKILRLFEISTTAKDLGVEIIVKPIPDPHDFISKINKAHAVKKFKTTFTGPNPVDADALFQKPLSYYCQQIDGEKGNVVVSGNSLNKEVVSAVARSTAATANHASALIQTNKGERPHSIQLKGDAKTVIIECDAKKQDVMIAIGTAYRGVKQ